MKKRMFRVVFQHCGFMPERDISEKELIKAHDQYVKMHNAFAKCSDQILDKLNKTWMEYEFQKEFSNEKMLKAMQKVMGIDDSYTYTKWIAKYYEEIGAIVDRTFGGYDLKSKIFVDGDAVHYGVVFKRNPNWSMYITIEEL